MLLKIFVFFTVLVIAKAQLRLHKTCPKVSVIQNFDASKYTGVWYEYAKYPTPFQTGRCTTATYSLNSDGSIGVLNKSILDYGQEISIAGTASPAGKPCEGKLRVSFPSVPSGGDEGPNYLILDTDYEHYAIVYSCRDVGNDSLRSAWILTRHPYPSKNTVKNALKVLKENSVDLEYFTYTDQTHC